MAKTELKYNPYLLETEILFNGIKPRVNSLVEKYQHASLQSWVKKVPEIFHDEMNGYDFDLEFSGTETDFEEIKRAFLDENVTEEEVRLIWDKNLKDRREKIKDLNFFLQWLNENDMQYFDNKAFRKRNEELFDGAYSFIVINGRQMDFSYYKDTDVAIEYINRISELNKTDLTNTPILFYVDSASLENLSRNIKYIQKRSDVVNDQLFFYVSPELSVSNVVRLIEDLGLGNPQLVLSSSDNKIVRYFELFPFTDYISKSIKELDVIGNLLSAQMEEVNTASFAANSEVHNRLNEYEQELAELKKAVNTYVNLKEPEIPSDWIKPKEYLMQSISEWKKKKTKITSVEEAESQSRLFESEVKELFNSFSKNLYIAVSDSYSENQKKLFDIIMDCPIGENGITRLESIPGKIETDQSSINIAGYLMEMKHDQYVTVKDDLRTLLFMQTKPDKDEQVLETAFYYQEWRDYACAIVKNLAESLIEQYMHQFTENNSLYIETYKTILENIIAEKTQQLESESSKLSDDEKKIQKDNEWVTEFKAKLEDLKRG